MLEDVADAVLNRVKLFTIGFGRAGDMPAVKGTGVLVKYGEIYGILTCAHVDKYLRKLNEPVVLVRLNCGPAQQSETLTMDEVVSYVAGAAPWNKGEEDIAFIHLALHLVGNIKNDCIFLDVEKNFSKPEPDDHSSLIRAHSVFGLVEEFTGATTRQNGRATTLVKGVLTSGVLLDPDAMTATLECFEENLPDLPDSFGGTSGGGLWRIYVRKLDDASFEVVHHRLIGIASFHDPESSPPRIICQGPGRIEALLHSVRRSMSREN